jgi:hypothetical protein
MTVTIEIPDAAYPTMVEGICAATGYTAESGKTQQAWAHEQVGRVMKGLAANGLAKKAAAAAKAALDAVVIG